jgi:hypothetical protein
MFTMEPIRDNRFLVPDACVVVCNRSIDESFADLVSICDLHWDLCETMHRYLRRHLADSSTLPLGTFQIGCELLLSVFSKKESLWEQLRDHLHVISRYKTRLRIPWRSIVYDIVFIHPLTSLSLTIELLIPMSLALCLDLGICGDWTLTRS